MSCYGTSVWAQNQHEQTHTLFFHVGKSNFDPLFRGNAASMNRIVDQLDSLSADPKTAIRSIKVSTSTSPEGGRKLNINLASERSRSIVRYLMMMYPRLTQQIVISSELAPDWGMLREQVRKGNMPMKEEAQEVLTLYRNYYDADLSAIDPRESYLRKLGKGKVWEYMYKEYFPDMRYAKVELLHELVDTNNVYIEQIVAPKQTDVPKRQTPVLIEADEPTPEPEPAPVAKPKQRRFIMALKTNLAYDVLGAVNGEIEIPVGQHWSISGQVAWPWFLHRNDKWAFQTGMAAGEVRYWFGDRSVRQFDNARKINPLTGHFIGLTGGWDYFDMCHEKNGNQGEITFGGITYGYSMRLCRCFNMEFTLGVGYAHIKYRHYHVMTVEDNNYLVRQYRDHTNWVGPIKAGVSLSWLLFNKKK